jgi:hypothetical protein
MDHTVDIECLHYGPHCRCSEEYEGVVFSIFIPKAAGMC